jgi:hypothetical protein
MDVCRLYSQQKKKRRINKELNHLGIGVVKRKRRAALKDDKGKILHEFLLVIMQTG